MGYKPRKWSIRQQARRLGIPYTKLYYKLHPDKCKVLRDKQREYTKTFVFKVAQKLRSAKKHAKKYGYASCKANVEDLMLSWTGCCEMCKIEGGTEEIQLDHCHTTGEFRGWLCSNCNTVLGLAKESPERLRAMAEYLEKWREHK
jgi:hypothetical protein